jgi:hypothetical protein
MGSAFAFRIGMKYQIDGCGSSSMRRFMSIFAVAKKNGDQSGIVDTNGVPS